MKTQYVNIGQALSGVYNLMIAGITDPEWIKMFSAFKLSPNKIGNYLFPLLKQLFRDSFTGSELEIEMVLLFVKNYFLLIVFTISQVALALRFKKSTDSTYKSKVLHKEDFYNNKQASRDWSNQILVS